MSTTHPGSEALRTSAEPSGQRLASPTVLPIVLIVAVCWGWQRWYDHHHQSLFSRYDRQYARTCLAGTGWGPPVTAARSTGTQADGWRLEEVPLSGPVRLVVTGNDPASTVLVFTASSRIGNGPLRPADEGTRQVLLAQGCSL